jgi:hypothetical protein
MNPDTIITQIAAFRRVRHLRTARFRRHLE